MRIFLFITTRNQEGIKNILKISLRSKSAKRRMLFLSKNLMISFDRASSDEIFNFLEHNLNVWQDSKAQYIIIQ